ALQRDGKVKFDTPTKRAHDKWQAELKGELAAVPVDGASSLLEKIENSKLGPKQRTRILDMLTDVREHYDKLADEEVFAKRLAAASEDAKPAIEAEKELYFAGRKSDRNPLSDEKLAEMKKEEPEKYKAREEALEFYAAQRNKLRAEDT